MLVGISFMASNIAAQEIPVGNWEGACVSGTLAGKEVHVQIIPEGDAKYRALIRVDGHSFALQGNQTEDVVTFAGETEISEVKYRVEAEAIGTRMTGEFKGGREPSQFEVNRVYRKPPTLGAPPPEGAVLLFDGTNFDAWHVAPRWIITDKGTMIIARGNIISKQSFGSQKLHVEFMTPLMPSARGQARGNSGVYVLGRYEIQVLDSFALEGRDDECGAIYKVAAPRVNACLPPTEWQTYDITFQAPKFDANGQKTANAVITVVHNGVTIHDQLVLEKLTAGGVSGDEVPEGPLMLQDHGDNVQYRNVWVQPLD